MIILEVLDTKYYIKNSFEELTIGEFEELNILLKSEFTTENFLNFFNLPSDVLNIIDEETILKIMKNFNFDTVLTKIKKEVVINDIKYKAYDGSKYIMTVEEAIQILEYIRYNPINNIGEIMAIVYKPSDFDLYNEKQIKETAKLFRQHLKADLVIPIMNYINTNITKNFLHYETTNQME